MQTMRRWIWWLQINLSNIEGYLRSTGYSIFRLGGGVLFSKGSLLDAIRKKFQNWLEIILRLIYNSGGFLVPIPW